MRVSRKSYELKDSAPCVDCYESMKRLGIKTIVYSTSSGAIVKSRLNAYKPSSYSLGRRFIMNDYVEVNKHSPVEPRFQIVNPLDAFMRIERAQEETDIESLKSYGTTSSSVSDTISLASSDSDDEYFTIQFADMFRGTLTKVFKRRRVTLYYDNKTKTQKACFI